MKNSKRSYMIILKPTVMKLSLFSLVTLAMAMSGNALSFVGNGAAGVIYADANSGATQYKKLLNPYVATDCISTTSDPCTYTVTTKGASRVTASSYSASQMADFNKNGDVIASSHLGIYGGN